MAPRGAKPWNEDLVKALRARADQKRQQGKSNFISFQQAAEKIAAVRKDIYAFQNGRVVNLPHSGLSVTTNELCRGIIAGDQPVLPPGYVPTLPEDRVEGNPFATDPYLTKIKIRGGAFAILMAFHLSQRTVLTKEQIIASGQRFCDEEMDANWHNGRPHGAWSGNTTLKKHGLINVNNRVAFREGVGLRAQGKSTYELTRDGEKFIEALLDRHPHIRQEVEVCRAAAPQQSPLMREEGYVQQSVRSTQTGSHRGTSKVKHSGLSENSKKDFIELRAWVLTAAIGNQNVFKVGKDRRRALHDECDMLNSDLAKSGRSLRHESSNVERSRELFVTMVASEAYLSNTTPALVSSFASPSSYESEVGLSSLVDWSAIDATRTSNAPPKARRALFGDDVGCRLNSASTPPKRARKIPPSSVAAGAAALERQAIRESLQMAGKQQSALVQSQVSSVFPMDNMSDNDRKLPARTTSTVPNVSGNGVISLVDGNDLDEEARPVISKIPSISRSEKDEIVDLTDSQGDEMISHRPAACKSGMEEIVDLTDSQGQNDIFSVEDPIRKCDQCELTIFIDDRERNRNATPRLLRTELERLVSTGVLADISHHFVSSVRVVEKSLKIGDFAFSREKNLLSPSIERKSISDLVTRSFRKDHWFQMHRMRDAVTSDGVFFFLLEGDFRTAVQYTPHGAEQAEEYGPGSHAIDREESVIRFLGRAILSSKKARFMQTKDVQGSLRAVGALGFVAASRLNIPPVSTTEVNAKSELSDFLRGLGVPWKLALSVFDEIGSKKQLDLLYSSIDDETCRSRVLAPLLFSCSKELQYAGTALGWSRAIYKAYSSVPPTRSLVKEKFTSLSGLVEDQALLLESLYSFSSSEEALNHVYDSPQFQGDAFQRVVAIALPLGLHDCFPTDRSEESVFSLSEYENKDALPCVTMQTKAGPYQSDQLALFIIEGRDLVKRLRADIDQCTSMKAAALQCAASIRADCCASRLYNPATDSCVLIIRGLNAALDGWAKMVGYQSKFRVTVDLLLADLSVSRDTVVLQAVRLKDDLEIMLQQLALSCYHYQLLTRA
jgi:hypothetical protein